MNSSTPITSSTPLSAALNQPSGARYFRCALQVNPFEYLRRNACSTPFATEGEYNAAIVAACQQNSIEVIAITDHFRFSTSLSLATAARSAGIFVFPAFEAESKDGIHLLCLFDPTAESNLDLHIGSCNLADPSALSPQSGLDCEALLAKPESWGNAAIIAAHATSPKGILTSLRGQARARLWQSAHLLACAIPGPVAGVPVEFHNILLNSDPQYSRSRPVAVLNASDVNGPEDLALPSSSTWIKMSYPTIEALRQAFLDPESRIRLNSHPKPEPHTELLAAAWQGGWLDGTQVRFNSDLNSIIGGRGAGKSTLIESLRYALDAKPSGEEALSLHNSIIKHAVKDASKISLLARVHHPAISYYTIERTVPNPPQVFDEGGTLLPLTPMEALPGIELYGQHEISELTRDPGKLTQLLHRFVNPNSSVGRPKCQIRQDLERSRAKLLLAAREHAAAEERLATLPQLLQREKQFRSAGLEDRLKEKSQMVREQAIAASALQRLQPLREIELQLHDALPLDTAAFSPPAVADLPDSELLARIAPALERLSASSSDLSRSLAAAISETKSAIGEVQAALAERELAVDQRYQKVLNDLQKEHIDGAQFIDLRKKIAALEPIRDRDQALQAEISALTAERKQLLVEWQDALSAAARALQAAAKKVNKRLGARARANVSAFGDRSPLTQLLQSRVKGNINAACERLKLLPSLSLSALADDCRKGPATLQANYDLPQGAAEKIAAAGEELFMLIEEVEFVTTTELELNTGSASVPNFQPLGRLSTGQRATAVLLLLLLESNAPLIVDQPEDDLDNRFITEGIVPIMREEKRRRQFLFSTHNANIPVLGDAELILGLTAEQPRIQPQHMGSIDADPVRAQVEEILEGGREAFETRRAKYHF
ncbi:MAG TPA: AAA family ATPase [Terriglobales bacterium]|nr:AAA family ATPase [Terriglobales bacterium]